VVLPVPTFEMIARYAELAGATVVPVVWRPGHFPVEEMLQRVCDATRMIVVVSPNNPTGAIVRSGDLARLSEAAPHAVLLVDLAYTEFADEDLTPSALALNNTIVIRTFSKAYGLAGMRVGYAVAREDAIRAMRAAGSPYPVSAVSLAAAEMALELPPDILADRVARVVDERGRLGGVLGELGGEPAESQANFVLAEFKDTDWVWRALAALGIAVRRFAEGSGLERMLRITCPGDHGAFARLVLALKAAVRPDALLFDLDGVIADVSGSYRRAIALTAESFGVRVSPADIAAAKREGGSNNDWILTRRLVGRAGIEVSLEEVVARFEELYQGTEARPGLKTAESLIPERALLEQMARRLPLGIVTGRPRRDCNGFLLRHGLKGLFSAVICMEDAPLKPSPVPVQLALSQLSARSAWLIGDTPDDLNAARAASVVPIGIAAPGEPDSEQTLEQSGAARVLRRLSDLEGMLP
jgi:HAD superfamily hydrolase (TIGR01548 family)